MNDKKDFLSECELRIAAEALRGVVDSMESIPGIDKATVEKLAKALENAKEPVDSEGLEVIFRRHGVEGRILTGLISQVKRKSDELAADTAATVRLAASTMADVIIRGLDEPIKPVEYRRSEKELHELRIKMEKRIAELKAERDAINGELQEVYGSIETERKRADSMANLAGEYGGTISELKQEVKDLIAAKETAYLQGQLDAYKEFVKKSQCWD